MQGSLLKVAMERLIDRFRERIMFPIKSVTGRVLGFGGRTLKKDKKEAKYINSPETKIYNKSTVLFNLDLAKDQIRKSDECFLVEGYTDVIGLHKKGIYNVVASLGTSLTQEHTKLVKRFTNNLTFIFDGDEAGIKASLRGIDIALKNELNIKAIALPEGEDPDTFSNKNDNEDLLKFFDEKSLDFILFKTQLLIKGDSADPIKKADAIKNIIKSVSIIPNHINRSNYIKALSREIDIDEETLYRELNNQLLNQRKEKNKIELRKDPSRDDIVVEKKTDLLSATTLEQEKVIIKLLLTQGNTEYGRTLLLLIKYLKRYPSLT
jgi:DNA primase